MNEPADLAATDKGAPRASVKPIIGLVLIVVGVLWAALSGLSSVALFITLLAEGGGGLQEALEIFPMIALVGSFTVGLGYVLCVVGRALRPES